MAKHLHKYRPEWVQFSAKQTGFHERIFQHELVGIFKRIGFKSTPNGLIPSKERPAKINMPSSNAFYTRLK